MASCQALFEVGGSSESEKPARAVKRPAESESCPTGNPRSRSAGPSNPSNRSPYPQRLGRRSGIPPAFVATASRPEPCLPALFGLPRNALPRNARCAAKEGIKRTSVRNVTRGRRRTIGTRRGCVIDAELMGNRNIVCFADIRTCFLCGSCRCVFLFFVFVA